MSDDKKVVVGRVYWNGGYHSGEYEINGDGSKEILDQYAGDLVKITIERLSTGKEDNVDNGKDRDSK